MLIVYRKDTGEVVDNTGTSSAWPEGPPDDGRGLPYLNLPEGLTPADVGLLRLHDVEDAELVNQVLANRHHVEVSGPSVAIDGPYPVRSLAPVDGVTELPADGESALTVVYTNTRDDAPGSVTFLVNDATVEVALTSAGTAHLDVVATEPGQVDVVADGLTLPLTATEV